MPDDMQRVHERLDSILEKQSGVAVQIQQIKDSLHESPCPELIAHRQWHRDQEEFRWEKVKLTVTVVGVCAAVVTAVAAWAGAFG